MSNAAIFCAYVHTDLYDNLDVIPFDKIQKFFSAIIVSYDGFDPNEKTEFYSMEDECEKIELEIKKKYGGRIKATAETVGRKRTTAG